MGTFEKVKEAYQEIDRIFENVKNSETESLEFLAADKIFGSRVNNKILALRHSRLTWEKSDDKFEALSFIKLNF